MTRDEFLQELRIALQGQIAQSQVNEHLRYYENYIIEESRKGRTQEEVLASLGSPRLIAKTIVETYGGGVYRNVEEEEVVQRRFAFRLPKGRLASFVWPALFFLLCFGIGAILLPVLIFLLLAATAFYLIYLIFFGNKK